MKTTNDLNYFWKKKEYVSFFLSILVFLIHISSFAQYQSSGSFISEVNVILSFFFKESITRFAVPMFFILSGMTFFKDYSNRKYFYKIKSRISTLIIPYLIWNTIWMLFQILCSYSFLSKYFIGREKFELSFINILKGIFFYEANIPFWFIFDLIVFAFASPLINLIVNKKSTSIIIVFILSILSVYGIHIPTNLFYSSNSILFYLIGAIIGKHYFYVFAQKSTKKMKLLSVLYLSVYVLVKNLFPFTKVAWSLFLEVIIFTLCAFSIWNILDIFVEKIKPHSIYSHSFAIYAMHINISAIVTKLLFIILPKNEYFAFPNFILTVIITLGLINLFCIILECYAPKIYAFIMGKR